MREDWVNAGVARQFTGKFYGVRVLNSAPGALWRFDGNGLFLPITALHSRRPPKGPRNFWEFIEITAGAGGETRVMFLEDPAETLEEHAGPISAQDASGRGQVVPASAELLFDQTVTSLTDFLSPSFEVSRFTVVKGWINNITLAGGSSPTVTLYLADLPPALQSYPYQNIYTAQLSNGGGPAALMAGQGLVVGSTNFGTQIPARMNYAALTTHIIGAPSAVSYRLQLWGFYS